MFCYKVNHLLRDTAQKVSVFQVFLPVFSRIRTEYGEISLRIQSECGKIRARKAPNRDAFYAVGDKT